MAMCAAALAASRAQAVRDRVKIVVIDPVSRMPIPTGGCFVRDLYGAMAPLTLMADDSADLRKWRSYKTDRSDKVDLLLVPAGSSIAFHTQTDPAQGPVKDIYVQVTATRLLLRHDATSGGTERTKGDITKFVNTTSGDTKALTKGQSGVAEDSAGQQHVRGEHTDITYVVDGVPLPDTLSGRQGSVVVPATIESLDILTGAFAPEFGGQTAAVLNIATVPGAKKSEIDATLQGGGYRTFNTDLTAVGPLGKRASYVFDFGTERTSNAIEPPQPDNQTAHNGSRDRSLFGKFRVNPSVNDSLTLTVSQNPGSLQIGNRTGLPASFAQAGEGYGFRGFRNADGTRPDAVGSSALGAERIVLPTQQGVGQDIDQSEVSEFGVLAWNHRMGLRDSASLALTGLHSGQNLTNRNPAVDILNLPVDSPIEYDPTVSRNVHHVQLVGSVSAKRNAHALKFGFLYDKQSGAESYNLIPGSQLALDALANLAPNLVPAGSSGSTNDVNGNPIYTPTSGVSPTVRVSRSGYYAAAYAQDSWKGSPRFDANYGVRADWYSQTQDLGQPPVRAFLLSPRLNFSYRADRNSVVRWSYNRLFNTPPLAQGAIVGQPIQPETLNQYEASFERQIARNQSFKIAYYYKQIKNQVDVGLLVPGSQIGLYSGVNFQKGGVHGLEVSYDIVSTKGAGWDGYLNYTHSAAKPNGFDNTGARAPQFNDHDQRQTIGLGLAYSFKNGATAAATFQYGTGLASSPIAPTTNRVPRSSIGLRLSTGPQFWNGRGGFGIDVDNLLDERRVINFQSGFSGTRFMQGRRVLASIFVKF